MSTTTGTDTFARFVELLAESLDDHETSGEALAACLHLSRFHFDRLVSAAAGEPRGFSPPHPARELEAPSEVHFTHQGSCASPLTER